MIPVMKKLKSKSGISLAIALVFFLLCAMVGTVVLSAASVSAGNTARERQLYRETLALTSAANILSQDIQGMTFTGSYTKTETVTTTVFPENTNQSTTVETENTYEKGTCELSGSKLFLAESDPGGKDDLNLLSLFFANQSGLDVTATTKETKLTFGAVEAQNIPEVTGQITVDPDYTITVVLQCGENSMTMVFPGHATQKTEVADHPTVTTSGNVTKKSTVTTYTTTLTWDSPVMKEGGAIHEETP